MSPNTLYDAGRYVLRTIPQEKYALWDDFVAGHANGHLLQCWDWGELKAAAGWQPIRLALWDEHAHRMVAAAQILRRSAPLLPLWAGHLAYIPKGPVIDWPQTPICEAFFTQLHALLRRQGAIALRLEPGPEADTSEGVLAMEYLGACRARRTLAIQPLRTIVLDLAPDEETLLAQMKEKWRYNIRLAARKGVTVRDAASIDDLRLWYDLLQVTSQRDQFGVHTFDYYRRAWELFVSTGKARLLLAEHEGRLLAGIFVALFARQGIYLYGASSNEQRQLMPNYLLQWEAIRWSRQQGARLYDFWGIPDTDAEDEAMAGVYRFKRGWGGRVAQFPGGYEQAYRPLMMKLADRFMASG
ncbi:MAG TPA: peptidoglycan bridge formation glycyltransferase FemA/FemB family protein [Ktedonobacteraceae bacterium]|nr:peptidoglycan bridge formation glycyltransferase FemA/FemB family protein [Ktedonobacteraceae bacterium]